jgi:hypothetical protein
MTTRPAPHDQAPPACVGAGPLHPAGGEGRHRAALAGPGAAARRPACRAARLHPIRRAGAAA